MIRVRPCAVLSIAVCWILVVSLPVAVHAQETRTQAMDSPGSSEPTDRSGRSAQSATLALDRFLAMVLRSNPEVQSIQLEDDRAAAMLLDARGGFDPRLASGYEFKTKDDKDKLNVLRSGLSLPFNLPLSPSLTLDYRRGLGSSIDPSVSTSDFGETRFGIEFSPLQGITTDKRRAKLRKARLEPRRADAVQATRRNLLLLDATQAYLTWTQASQVLQVNRDLLDLASRRQSLITRRARVGEEAAIDSVEAELAAVSRQGKVADATRKAEQAATKLAVFLWEQDGTPMTFDFEAPETAELLSGPVLVEDSLRAPEAIATALDRRPELQEIDLKLRQTRIQQRLARAELRPDIKLEAQAVSYDDTPANISDVKLGLKLDQSLFFRGNRSAVETAEIETLQIDLKRDLTERKVTADVEAALIGIRQARRRVDAAERRVQLARRLQQAEQRRFELGESTLFLLNQREQAFAEARIERIEARIEVRRAQAEYRWATGTIADPYTTVR